MFPTDGYRIEVWTTRMYIDYACVFVPTMGFIQWELLRLRTCELFHFESSIVTNFYINSTNYELLYSICLALETIGISKLGITAHLEYLIYFLH